MHYIRPTEYIPLVFTRFMLLYGCMELVPVRLVQGTVLEPPLLLVL